MIIRNAYRLYLWRITNWNPEYSRQQNYNGSLKQKEEERKKWYTYALTGFSCAIFHMKKNPRASITVKTPIV